MATVAPDTITHTATCNDSEEKERVIKLANTEQAKRERVKLAAAYRILARRGLDDGIAGHISLRVPGAPDYFWVNPFGKFFHEVTAENLVLVNHHGEILEGGDMINFAGFCIHSAIHKLRPDVACACHTHPPNGTAFSALGIEIEALDQVGCSFFEDHVLHTEYGGVVLDSDYAEGIAAALGNKRALVLQNHGLLTCGTSVEQALIDMLDMERTCTVNLKAYASGRKVHPVPAESARQARAVYTQPHRYPFNFAALIRQLNKFETDYDPWFGGEYVMMM
jgi:ribulose-5-phosphate 4-epimerase/fuculose-1-phosphate aldolase